MMKVLQKEEGIQLLAILNTYESVAPIYVELNFGQYGLLNIKKSFLHLAV